MPVREKLRASRVIQRLVVRLHVSLDRLFELGRRVGVQLSCQRNLFRVKQAELDDISA